MRASVPIVANSGGAAARGRDFVALRDEADAERLLVLEAGFRHLDVALLEDLERQQAAAETAPCAAETAAARYGCRSGAPCAKRPHQADCVPDASRCGAIVAPARLERVRHAQLVEHARDDEVDEVGDRLRMHVEARAPAAGSRRRPARASACCRDGSPTAAFRAARGPAGGAPSASRRPRARSGCRRGRAAIAPSVPIVHGQMAIASAGFEPEATGAIQSSRANTVELALARAEALARTCAPPRAAARAA